MGEADDANLPRAFFDVWFADFFQLLFLAKMEIFLFLIHFGDALVDFENVVVLFF